MQIRRLTPSDAVVFQRLRLQGLLESPTAFGSSYEEEVDRPIEAVAESLGEGSGRYVFGAFVDDQLVGIVAVGREAGIKEMHRGFVRSMYVEPTSRRQGIGKALMAEVVQFAQEMPGLRQLMLAVTACNLAAVATYKAFGFEVCGTLPEALQVDGRYFDELQMVRHLGAA